MKKYILVTAALALSLAPTIVLAKDYTGGEFANYCYRPDQLLTAGLASTPNRLYRDIKNSRFASLSECGPQQIVRFSVWSSATRVFTKTVPIGLLFATQRGKTLVNAAVQATGKGIVHYSIMATGN